VSNEESGRKAVVVLAAAAVLLLVAVIALSVVAVKWHGEATDAKDETAAGRAALAQAKEDIVQLASYSYQDGAADYPDYLGDFTSDKVAQPYVDSAKEFQKVIIGTKTVAKASIIDAAYRVVSKTDVEILAFVDQVMTSNTQKGVSVDQQRIQMTMKLVGGTWKIDDLQYQTHVQAH